MKIIVASKNPNKVEAVKETFAEYEFTNLAISSVEALNAPEQPIGMDAICTGAKGRAEEVFSDCDLSVGIESGVLIIENKTMINLCVCSLYNGREHFLGVSSGFGIPENIAKYVREGKNISEACKLAGITDHEYLGYAQGLIGILSKGKLDRKKYTKQAIEMALMHYNGNEMYE